MTSEPEKLEAAIAALEARRAELGDTLVESLLGPARARLAALGNEPAQALKQVSILFLDVVGSTQLTGRLDPEAVSAVMDGALARAAAIVTAHRGKVLQYAGDNLLAAFGVDEALEDDAARAVRCGLELLKLGRALGNEVQAAHGHTGFDVRVGIHTGGVLLGGGVDAEGTIRGIAVNIAARMEQAAPAGALRISHDTYTQVRGAFDVEAQPPISVKGVDQPLLTYLVQRERPRAFRAVNRGIEGVATRLVGRDAELAQLQAAFTRMCGERRLAVLTVVGNAGLGKSRLLNEFEAWADEQPLNFRTVRARAIPMTQSQPYGLLRDALAWQMRIADGDSLAVARQKFEAGIATGFGASADPHSVRAHAHLLGHLLGIDFGDSPHVSGIKDDARQLRDRAFHAAALLLRQLTADGERVGGWPLLLLIEDLHWVDDGSMDFLSHLVDVNRELPILVLALTRPTLFERFPAWGSGAAQHRIDLHPLDDALSRTLVAQLLHKLPQVPPALSELLASRAEGNPFYLEELVKMLIDRGAIGTHGESWTFDAQRMLATQVPLSLTGVLQARLDGLPKRERLTLQQASVIGPVFWDQALAALDAVAPAALPALVRRELTVPRQDTVLDDVREYGFSHQLLHQVTYDTLLRRSRRLLHRRAAAWMAGLRGARAGDFLAATAEHFELAGELAQACEFFTRAAEQAQARFAHDVALRHAGRALALLESVPDADSAAMRGLRWRASVAREATLAMQGRRDQQRSALDALERLADTLQDDRLRALAAWRRSVFGMNLADYSTQADAARRAMQLAERCADAEARLRAQRLLADALGAQGEHAAGAALAHEGLAEARRRGLRRIEGLFLNALSLIAGQQDDQVSGLAFDLQDLPIWRELGDPYGEAIALSNIGADYLWFGQHERARAYLEDALKLCRAVGAVLAEIAPLGNLSQVLLAQGDAEQSRALARSALDLAVATHAPAFEAQTLCRAGEAELALGRHDAAAQAFERAETVAAAVEPGLQRDARAGRARVALARGDVPAALALVHDLLPLAGGAAEGEVVDMRYVLFTCHQVLARAGDPRAAQFLAGAHDALQARARTIADSALRDSFLGQVPLHRAIVAAWQSHGPGSGGQ